MHHYEQFVYGKGLVKYGVDNPLSPSNKYYSHQPHEKDAYNYTFKFLKQIYQELNLDGLDNYIYNQELIFKQMKQKINKLICPILNPVIKYLQEKENKQINIIKKYASDIYPDQTCINANLQVNQIKENGNPIQIELNLNQTQNYLDGLLCEQKENIINPNNSINLKVKNNKAVIFISDYNPPPDDIKELITFSETLIHKYNQDNNLKIENVTICPESVNIKNKDLEEIFKKLSLNKDSKLKINQNINQVIINMINKNINEQYMKNIFKFEIKDNQIISRINKKLLSIETLNLEIKNQTNNQFNLNTNNKSKIINAIEKYLNDHYNIFVNSRTLELQNLNIIDILKQTNLLTRVNNGDTLDTIIENQPKEKSEKTIQFDKER